MSGGDERQEAEDEPEESYPDVILFGAPLKRVSCFCYLGHLMNSKGTLANEIQARMANMRTMFLRLKESVFCNKHLSVRVKLEAFNAAVVGAGLYASEIWALTKTEAELIDGAQHKLLQCILGFGPRPGGSRVSQITCIEMAAQHGVIILPASVRMELARLRYGGHIARRQVYLAKQNKSCIQMDMLGGDVEIVAADILKTGGKAPGLMTFAKLINATAKKVTQGDNMSWDVRAKHLSKEGWRKYLKRDATRALMEAWLQVKFDEKISREAKTKEIVASGVLPDYHDSTCHVCKRKWHGGVKHGHCTALMCDTCDHIEHFECTNLERVPASDESYLCIPCTSRKSNPPTPREWCLDVREVPEISGELDRCHKKLRDWPTVDAAALCTSFKIPREEAEKLFRELYDFDLIRENGFNKNKVTFSYHARNTCVKRGAKEAARQHKRLHMEAPKIVESSLSLQV